MRVRGAARNAAYRVAARAGRRDDGNNESRTRQARRGDAGGVLLLPYGGGCAGSLARQYLKPARLALLHLHALAHRRARKLADKLPRDAQGAARTGDRPPRVHRDR